MEETSKKVRHTPTINAMQFKRYYFQNAAICGNCNGSGWRDYMDYCRCCRATGIEDFVSFRQNHKGAELISLRIDYNACVNALKGR